MTDYSTQSVITMSLKQLLGARRLGAPAARLLE